MKMHVQMSLSAAALAGLLALPAALPGAAWAADSDGSSTMDSMKQGAGDAAESVKNGAEKAGHAVKSGASSAYDTVKDTVKGTASNTSLPQPDREFVQKAAIAGMFEVKAAELAKDKASSSSVKSFAEKMITDHSKANEDLKKIADKKDIDLPTALDSEHQAKLDQVSKLSGTAFDKTYAQQQANGHDVVLALMRNEAKNGKDPDLKAFANKYDDVIAAHDRLAKKTVQETKSEK